VVVLNLSKKNAVEFFFHLQKKLGRLPFTK
jgi:hypothetical protein